MKSIVFTAVALAVLIMAGCEGRRPAAPAVSEKDTVIKVMDTISWERPKRKKYVMPKRLAEECRLHTIEMAKADSETYRRGYRYDLGDSIPMKPYAERKGTVQEVCEDAERLFLTDEQIQELDSWLANSSEYELVRNADRTLDTVVNHQRIIFTIEP